MKKEWNAVEILRHSRHDWLNKLQLIKGNLALERLDRVNEIIEEIIIETQNEAKLTNLKAPNLAALLMLFNWKEHYFFLEFEVLGEERHLSAYDEELTSWCFQFFEMLNQVIKPFAENHLILSIQVSDQACRFIFDFKGIIENTKEILDFLEEGKNNQSIHVSEYEVHNDGMLVTTNVLF